MSLGLLGWIGAIGLMTSTCCYCLDYESVRLVDCVEADYNMTGGCDKSSFLRGLKYGKMR